jgi:hypothetical protein
MSSTTLPIVCLPSELPMRLAPGLRPTKACSPF